MKDIFVQLVENNFFEKIIKREFLKECLYGYSKNYRLSSPTEEFYKSIKNKKRLLSLNYGSMNFDDRFELGLPVFKDEIYNFIYMNSPEKNKKLNITLGKNSIKFN